MLPDRTVEIPKSRKKSSAILWLAVITLIVAGGGVYYWQHQKVTHLQAELNSPSPTLTPSAPALTSDVARGVPLSISNTVVLTTLALPTGYGVINEWPTTRTQGELQSHYTTSANDFLASWTGQLLGTKTNPSNAGGSTGRVFIEITALSEWMAASDPSDTQYSDLQGAMTLVQKKSFVTGLQNATADCAKDVSKGFVTNDKVYSVCYSVLHPQAVDADYGVTLSGYATIGGQPVYLRGSIELPNSFNNHQAVLDKYISYLKQLATSTSTR